MPEERQASPAGEQAASIWDRLCVLPQYLLPQGLLTRCGGLLARWRWRPWKALLIRVFIRAFRVNMEESQPSDPAAYASFAEFFVRPLKSGCRPLAGDERTVLSPVDGVARQCIERMDEDQLPQAKGHRLPLSELFAGRPEWAQSFTGGSCATLYLAPRNYHRVHMPVAGRLEGLLHVPGSLFAVNGPAMRAIPRLFARNERLVLLFDTAAGRMAAIMVGALFVGGMETVWTGRLPQAPRSPEPWRPPPAEAWRDRGQELGRFHFGSTAILLFPPGKVIWERSCRSDAPVRMGQALGRLLPAARTSDG